MGNTAELLRALRKETALTQAALAERAGVRRGVIAHLESGVLKCTLVSTRRQLAKAYRLSLTAFDDYLEEARSLEDLLMAQDASAETEES